LQNITESVNNENIITAYRRTGKDGQNYSAADFVKHILSNGFSFEKDRNDLVGAGIYFAMDLKSLTTTDAMIYGNYVFKCQIDISKFLLIDRQMAMTKYGEYNVYNQIHTIVKKIPPNIDQELQQFNTEKMYFSDLIEMNSLLHEINIAPHYVKGMIVEIKMGDLGIVPVVWDKHAITIVAYTKHDANVDGDKFNWISANTKTYGGDQTNQIGRSFKDDSFNPKQHGFKDAPSSIKADDTVKIDGRVAIIKGVSPEGIFVVYLDRNNRQTVVVKPGEASRMRLLFDKGDKVINTRTGERGIVANDNTNGLYIKSGDGNVSGANDHDWQIDEKVQ